MGAHDATKSTRAHVHAERFPFSAERLFTLLYTPSAIRAWWGASRVIVLPEDGGLGSAVWGDVEDEPEYVTAATIDVFEPPFRMRLTEYRYQARTGPLPFEADFSVEFTVQPDGDGAVLRVEQAGFPKAPEADAFLAACEKGWAETFQGIRRYLNRM